MYNIENEEKLNVKVMVEPWLNLSVYQYDFDSEIEIIVHSPTPSWLFQEGSLRSCYLTVTINCAYLILKPLV